MDRETFKIIKVVWVDAVSIDAWTDIDEVLADSPHVIHSVGFLIKETDVAFYLALNHDQEAKTISCSMIIPKSTIVSPVEVLNG